MSMKRIIVFISVIIALLSVIIVYRVHETETKKLEAEKKELEELYYDQNTALRLCQDCDKRFSYHGVKDADMKELAIAIYAYNNLQSEYKLTIDEVIDYISKEFDSEGKPRIYSQPPNIKAYIDWSYIKATGYGNDLIHDYSSCFGAYLIEKGKPPYREMSYEEVVANLEEFQKDSEYKAFMQLE